MKTPPSFRLRQASDFALLATSPKLRWTSRCDRRPRLYPPSSNFGRTGRRVVMPSDTNISPANNPPPPDSVPPLLSPESKHKSGPRRQFFAILLSLCLALFLIDAVVSLVDDSLILFFGLHVFSVIRGLVAILALLM